MNYLLFNNEIFISDGQVVKKMEKGPALKEELDSRFRGNDNDYKKENDDVYKKGNDNDYKYGNDNGIENARICCVDVDVMIASAPQDYLDKKDSILAQKFEAAYSEGYITLNEKIDNNIFQVIGIKAEKVKEIYSLVPSSKVDAFVPYAIAIRSLLVNNQTNMAKLVLFVDDLGHEKLMTVFDGLKFSRTRTFYTDKAHDILPDIKRSLIDFNKKLGEFAPKAAGNLTIITNNKPMAEAFRSLEVGLSVDFLDCPFPALEGLKSIDTQIKYRIPEEIILERKKIELRSRLMHAVIAVCIGLTAALFDGLNLITYSFIARDFAGENLKNAHLKDTLEGMDQRVYRDSLKKSKNLNYSSVFFDVSGLLPSTYEVSSFKFSADKDHWIFDAYLFAQDDQFYDEISRSKILKKAEIKDFFIKNRPGKYLKVVL